MAAELITMAEFARRLGVGRSYVTQLRKEGRLVQDERGRVDEAASRELIAQTADPDKASKIADQLPLPMADAGEVLPSGEVIQPQQVSKARQAHYQALAAQRDYEVSMGRLMERAHVLDMLADAAVTFRSQLEALPGTVSAQLALIKDEREIRNLLADEVERVLRQLSAKFRDIEKGDRDE